MNPTAQAPAAVDVAPIIARTRDAIPPNLQAIFDRAVLSGMRIMFDKDSHKMMLDELDKPGPLATRISNGIIALVYLLWTQSNKTLPPQIIVPVTLTLTLKAFDFLQQSKEPDATKEVLGEATHAAVQGVMDRFGATEDKLPQLVKGRQAGPSKASAPYENAPTAPQPGGMLSAAGGQ